jgi:hypothetical protein
MSVQSQESVSVSASVQRGGAGVSPDQLLAVFRELELDNPAGARELVAYGRQLLRNRRRREARARAKAVRA